MFTISINDKEHLEKPGTTILQACRNAGVEIPRFCYHERLSIAGNCRMCLIEMVDARGMKSPKPIASCARSIENGMKIYTDTPLVKKAQEGVMEFLLLNHPLDCPICDQGGECDLQDQAMAFGNDRGRFYEYKRAVEDKNVGPLIKTIMTRCIHCTRCIRFAKEVAGVPIWGTSGRGSGTEVGMYIEKTFDSELSGNIIDLCPVGALTSKPYAFTSRSWELKNTETIDVLDAVGTNIRIDARGAEIMRILPRLNESINEEWLADKGRFSYDALKRQRLNMPMVRDKNRGMLLPASWKETLEYVRDNLSKLSGKDIGAIIGPLVDCESIISLKDLMNKLGSSNLYNSEKNYKFNIDLRTNYILNATIEQVEETDLVLLIGTNPRIEAPLLNTRIRKNYLSNNIIVASIGNPVDLTYPVEQLANNVEVLNDIVNKRHPFYNVIKNAKKPLILMGMHCFERKNTSYINNLVMALCREFNIMRSDWKGLGVVHTNASQVGALDLGFIPGKNSKLSNINKTNYGLKALYLLGADDINVKRDGKTFIIYQGHHGDISANKADVILPGAAYTEKNVTYVNIEGRPQLTKSVFVPPGESREDWKIIRALSEVIGVPLNYSNTLEIRKRLEEVAPHLVKLNTIQSSDFSLSLFNSYSIKNINKDISKDKLKTLFRNNIDNYYATDSISRNSQIMAKCRKNTSNYNVNF